MCDRAWFFGKNSHWAKMFKNDSNRVFGLFKKIMSLVLSEICVKRKFIVVYSAKTACLGKIWFSSYSQKWLSANEISVFFNRQYFTNRLISDFDFWHVDRHEWKKQGLLTGFVKKFSFQEMGAILGPIIVHPRNFGSTGRIFLKFCAMKGADR